jgi:hypothetical protein
VGIRAKGGGGITALAGAEFHAHAMRALLYIRMRDEDDVAMASNRGGLHPGAVFADGLQPIEQIPQGHKVALADIAADGVIRRYGEVIGYALRPIARGNWPRPGDLERSLFNPGPVT